MPKVFVDISKRFSTENNTSFSTSLLTKMYENDSITGLSQKSDSFFGVASTNCQTDGKNV